MRDWRVICLNSVLDAETPFGQRRQVKHVTIGPLKYSYESGSAVSSSSVVWGGAAAEIEFGAFFLF